MPSSLKLTSHRSDKKRIWCLIVPIALLALVMGTTLGMVWHHHVSSSPDNCPICHLNHQAIESSVASVRIYALVPTDGEPEAQPVNFVPSSIPRHIPPRAPPV
jgi:hypothetical protein